MSKPQTQPTTSFRTIYRRVGLYLLAFLMVATIVPPYIALAEPAPLPAEDEAGISIEEHYRESDINFFGEDIASACGASTPGSGGPANITVDKGFSLGTDAKERRVNLVRALMTDYGLTGEQASGIVGNFMQESGGEHLPPDVNEGDRTGGPPQFSGGYGWAQWTGPRQRAFIDFAVANGYMASRGVNATDATNYAWLKDELNTAYQSTITELKATSTPEDAAFSFHKTFERSADSRAQIGERGTSARQVFDELNGGNPTAGGGATATPGGSCPGAGGGAAIVGANAFPLQTTRTVIDNENPGMFSGGTTSKGGHPYTAYDILVPPGTPVLAFLSGTVTNVGEDRCPGRIIGIYNAESDLTISYLHNNLDRSTHVAEGDTIALGQQIAVVGPAAAGCGIPHLHIDAAQGNSRPGCSRLNCPAANASKFVDIGPQLFTTYESLNP